ncbi:hypothetical protein NMG60_11005859 [Bertholletia excelsa]
MMDIGMVGLDGLAVSVSDSSCFASSLVSDPETKQKWYGSDLFLKQERSSSSSSSSGPAAEADLRSLKVAKTDEFFSASKAILLQQQRSNNLQDQHQFQSPLLVLQHIYC